MTKIQRDFDVYLPSVLKLGICSGRLTIRRIRRNKMSYLFGIFMHVLCEMLCL